MMENSIRWYFPQQEVPTVTESFLASPISSLTNELLQKFVATCTKLSRFAGLFIGFALSSHIWSIDPILDDFCHLPVAPAVLARAASQLQMGLTQLNVSPLHVHDDFLVALGSSSAAKTLKKFIARQSFISDRSASAWASFSVLEVIDINLTASVREGTVLALANIPTLKTLAAYASKPFEPDFLHSILSKDKLPFLETLDINMESDDNKELPVLLEVLKKRNNLDLIQSIQLNTYWPFSEEIRSLHMLCPNLTSIHGLNPKLDAASSDAFIRSAFSNIRTISVGRVFTNIPAGWCQTKLPELFPSLETLFIVNHEMTDFSAFTNLTSLTYRNRTVLEIRGLPASLRELNLEFVDTDEPPVPASETDISRTDALISLVASSFPLLEELNMFYPDGAIKKRHVELLLPSLKHLKNLRLKCYSAKRGASETNPFRISHPMLTALPDVAEIDNLLVVPEYLPSVETALIGEKTDVARWVDIKKSQVPNLNGIHLISTRPRPWDPADDEAMDSVARTDSLLRNLSGAIGLNLSCLNASIRLSGSTVVGCLPSYGRICDLNLLFTVLSVTETRQVLSATPWLSFFLVEIHVDGTMENFDCINHPRVARLDLVLREDGTEQRHQRPLNFHISPTTLPMLRRFACEAKLNRHVHLTLQNLHSLQRASVRGSLIFPHYNICITACPFVDQIYVDEMVLNQFQLGDSADFLSSLSFTDVRSGPQLRLSKMPQRLPGLCQVRVRADLKFSEFAEQLRAATPQSSLWSCNTELQVDMED